MTFAQFLVGLVGPMAARLLASLGMSLVTVTGLALAVDQLRTLFVSSVGGLPASVIGLAGLMGVWECAGIWLGAGAFVVSWQMTRGFWMLAKS